MRSLHWSFYSRSRTTVRPSQLYSSGIIYPCVPGHHFARRPLSDLYPTRAVRHHIVAGVQACCIIVRALWKTPGLVTLWRCNAPTKFVHALTACLGWQTIPSLPKHKVPSGVDPSGQHSFIVRKHFCSAVSVCYISRSAPNRNQPEDYSSQTYSYTIRRVCNMQRRIEVCTGGRIDC